MFHLNDSAFGESRKCEVCDTIVIGRAINAELFYHIDAACETLACPRGCNFVGKSMDIWRHLRTKCDFATTTCDYCAKSVLRSDLKSHECKRVRYCICSTTPKNGHWMNTKNMLLSTLKAKPTLECVKEQKKVLLRLH